MPSSYWQGLGLGFSLIIAIGAQNAHVLRMGLRRQHIGLNVITCITCEILLIAAGIAGMGALIERAPMLMGIVRWGGAAFLIWYGLRAWHSALQDNALATGAMASEIGARQALAAILAMTLLNPHVYLDTVVLLGSIGGRQPGSGKFWFGLGAISAAVAWFVLLGYGARWLAPWFARPLAWKILDSTVGLVMLALAATLILQG